MSVEERTDESKEILGDIVKRAKNSPVVSDFMESQCQDSELQYLQQHMYEVREFIASALNAAVQVDFENCDQAKEMIKEVIVNLEIAQVMLS